jgi:ABC-type uncharacterized transport system ATPase subunit
MSEVILEAKDICKYFGGLKAVEKVNMQVEKGTFSASLAQTGREKPPFSISAQAFTSQLQEIFCLTVNPSSA